MKAPPGPEIERAALAPDWIHSMHGGTLTGDSYRGMLLGREAGVTGTA